MTSPGVRAASTVGIWLRAFVWASVRQRDRVTRELLRRAWAAGLGPTDPTADLTIDIDSSVVETYGLAKQGAKRFAYTGVRGYHPLLASLAQTGSWCMPGCAAGRPTPAAAPRRSSLRRSHGCVTPAPPAS